MNVEYSSCWRVKSWDRLMVPRPFGRARVVFGKPHHVRPTDTDEDFERERLLLQEKMMELVQTR